MSGERCKLARSTGFCTLALISSIAARAASYAPEDDLGLCARKYAQIFDVTSIA
jgi:hypothetical protein